MLCSQDWTHNFSPAWQPQQPFRQHHSMENFSQPITSRKFYFSSLALMVNQIYFTLKEKKTRKTDLKRDLNLARSNPKLEARPLEPAPLPSRWIFFSRFPGKFWRQNPPSFFFVKKILRLNENEVSRKISFCILFGRIMKLWLIL